MFSQGTFFCVKLHKISYTTVKLAWEKRFFSIFSSDPQNTFHVKKCGLNVDSVKLTKKYHLDLRFFKIWSHVIETHQRSSHIESCMLWTSKKVMKIFRINLIAISRIECAPNVKRARAPTYKLLAMSSKIEKCINQIMKNEIFHRTISDHKFRGSKCKL